MQTIKITISSPNLANIHIKECKTKDEEIKEKLAEVFKKLSFKKESDKSMEG